MDLPAPSRGEEGRGGDLPRRESRARDLSEPLILAGVFLFALLLRSLVWLEYPTPRDDAFIVFRVARNLAAGAGFVFNAGERVQAVSSPLYGLLTAGTWWLAGARVTIPVLQGLGAVADSLAAVLLALLVSASPRDGRLRLSPAGLLAGILYAGCSSSALVASHGLETGLYTCAIAAAFLALRREKVGPCLVASTACALLRPEGALVPLVVLAARFAATRRLPLRELAWVSLAALPYAVFAVLYYGSVLPQTVVAKSLVERSTAAEWWFIAQKLWLGAPASAILGTAAWIGAVLLRRRPTLIPIVGWGAAYLALFSSLGSWWPWYVPPVLLAFFALAGTGLAAATRAIAPPRLARVALALAMPGVAPLLARDTMAKAERNLGSSAATYAQMREAAEWVNEHTAPTATVMLEPLGIFGYHVDRVVEDYPGLASRRVTNAMKRLNRAVGGNPQDHEALRAAIDMVKPEVLVLREPEYAVAAGAGELDGYELRHVSAIPWVSNPSLGAPVSMMILTRSAPGAPVGPGQDPPEPLVAPHTS